MGYEMCDPGLHPAPKANIKGCVALFRDRSAPGVRIHHPNSKTARTVADLGVNVEPA